MFIIEKGGLYNIEPSGQFPKVREAKIRVCHSDGYGGIDRVFKPFWMVDFKLKGAFLKE